MEQVERWLIFAIVKGLFLYLLGAIVVEGTQQDHVQHQWVHHALLFKSHSSSVCTGLVGIPMMDIKLRKNKGAHDTMICKNDWN